MNLKGNVVLKFYADWCGPCKVLKPVVDELKDENKETNFQDIDVDTKEGKEVASTYGVRSLPTIVFVREGKEVSKLIGGQSKEIIQQHIDMLSE